MFRGEDIGPHGRLTAAAAAAMASAVSSLQEWFGFEHPSDPVTVEWGVLMEAFAGSDTEPVQSPAAVAAAAAGGDGGAETTHFDSWLGAMAVLRPLRLHLVRFVLSPRDMLGLAGRFSDLKHLDLRGCSFTVSSLPLLSGMCALERRVLDCDDWKHQPGAELGEGALELSIVEAAFMGLVGLCRTRQPSCLSYVSTDSNEVEDEIWLGDALGFAIRYGAARLPEPVSQGD